MDAGVTTVGSYVICISQEIIPCPVRSSEVIGMTISPGVAFTAGNETFMASGVRVFLSEAIFNGRSPMALPDRAKT